MAIRVIYKDMGIGIVKESDLDGLIKSGRIAAYCFSNDEWLGVETDPNGGAAAREREKIPSGRGEKRISGMKPEGIDTPANPSHFRLKS